MRKILILTAAAAAGLLALTACQSAPEGDKVMARYVPERADDFVWENDLVAYRAYGKALEGNPTSPGFDVWVKKAGKLPTSGTRAPWKTLTTTTTTTAERTATR